MSKPRGVRLGIVWIACLMAASFALPVCAEGPRAPRADDRAGAKPTISITDEAVDGVLPEPAGEERPFVVNSAELEPNITIVPPLDERPEDESLPVPWDPSAGLFTADGRLSVDGLPKRVSSRLGRPCLHDDASIEYNIKRTITSHFGGANSAQAIDIDGDGDMDIIGSAYDVDEIALWENDGDAAFTRQTIDNAFSDAMYARAADIDGDGNVDIVGAAYSDGIAWWENDGRERFTAHVVANTLQFPSARMVKPADIDSDGDTDLVGVGGSRVTWWRNEGAGSFSSIDVTTVFTGVRAILPIDLDGDGDVDLVGAAHNETDEADVVWWENDGDETFSPHTVDAAFNGAFCLDAVDLDGDGDCDILGAASNANELSWWENQGDGTLTKHIVAEAFDAAMAIVGADIDGDNDMDLVGASFVDGITWFENDGESVFASHDLPGTLEGAWSLDVADINGDGELDLLCAAGLKHDSKVVWWRNDGEESFALAIIASDFAGAISTHAADLDGDGDQDVLGAAYSSNKIVWWENQDGLHFAEHIVTNTAYGINSVCAADLDGDDDLDILCGARYDGVKWWQNNGAGDFALRTIANDFADARSVHAVDLDGDGDMDVLGAANNDSSEVVDIAWWENDGGGGFTQHDLSNTFGDAMQVVSADVDSDGDCDIVAAGGLSVVWWENNGAESFSAHIVSLDCPYAYTCVVVADLDGDSDMDVLGGRLDEIKWFVNDGQEVFTATDFDSDFCEVRAITMCDVDGDSDLDVLGAAYGTGELVWWENATSTYTRRSIVTGFDGACDVTAADLAGDGQVNVIGVAYDADEIAWWSQYRASLDLVAGWNMASFAATPMDTSPASVLESIAGSYEIVFAYDAETSEWLWYDPADEENSTLRVIDETVGLWIHMTEAATVTMLAIPLLETDQDLVEGWNLISYPARETRPIASALRTIDGNYAGIASYVPGADQPWQRYTTGVPDWLNTLNELSIGNAYWVNVSTDCTLVIED